MNKISATIVAHSKNEFGDEIATMVCVFPRYILAELNTHRMFSRNSASSRAIPFNKMLKMVQDDPFIPIAWQKEHKGMQGTEYISDKKDINSCVATWKQARGKAMHFAQELSFEGKGLSGVTKQLCNRLLEPFMWHTALITSTEWENFFKLRCPKYILPARPNISFRSWKDLVKFAMTELNYNIDVIDRAKAMTPLERLQQNIGQADIHMMLLAEAMYDALNESTARQLKAGEWHIPFGDKIDENRLASITYGTEPKETWITPIGIDHYKIKIATARCARVSYLNFEGKDDYEGDIDLYNSLVKRPYTNRKGITFSEDDPIHASPSEHCARAMDEGEHNMYYKGKISGHEKGFVYEPNSKGWCNNFKGFIQLRSLIEK